MIGMKIYRSFICNTYVIDHIFSLQHQKSCIIIFKGMNIWSNNVELKKLCSQFAGYCRGMFITMLMDEPCTKGSVFCFYNLPFVLIQKTKTLLYCHWM